MNKENLGEILTATEMLFDITFEERFQRFVINNHITSEIESDQNE